MTADSSRARKFKDKAVRFYAKGKYDKALLAYKEVIKADPRDLSSRLRLGDLYKRLGEEEKAIRVYGEVADFYAKDGFLLKAIAACKLILEVDAQHTDTQSLLAELYSSKYGSPPPGTVAPVPSGAAPVPATGAAGVAAISDALDPPMAAAGAETAEIELPTHGEIELEVEDGLDDDEIEIDLDALGDDPLDISEVEPPPMPAAPAPKELPTIPLFSDLPQDAFITLMEQMKLRRLMPGDVVIRQGETGDSFFVVAAGTLKVYREVEGQQIELARLGDGHFFGEMALLSDDPRSATVAAVEECEVFELSKTLLTDLTARYSSLEEALQRFYRQRLVSNTLASSPLFRPFDKDQRRELLGRFTALEVPPGEVIVSEGTQSEGIYLLVVGEVAVTRGTGFEEVTLARLTQGQIFGEMSLINGTDAGATVRAIRPCTILRLPETAFRELMMTHPQILEVASELTAERERQNAEVLDGTAGIDEDGLLLF